MKRIIAIFLAALLMMSMAVLVSADELDKSGEYEARLGIQAQTADEITWVQRIGYYDNDDGQQVYSGTYGKDTCVYYDGTFTDATIKGNGTYTVSYTTSDIAGVERFTQLHVATNIPYTTEITFSDLTVEINGSKIGTYRSVFVDDDNVAGDYCVLLAFNHWRKHINDDTAAFDPLCIPTSGEITISLTFTVSGFDYDNPDQTEPETTAAPTTEAPETTAPVADAGSSAPASQSWIYIVVAIVVVAAVVIIVVVSKKKK